MGRLFVGLSILIALTSCDHFDGSISNLNGNEITVLGHAGMGYGDTYPMNSMESLIACLSAGSDGTELDVQITKDGKLVAFHDEELNAKTNFTGRVNAYTKAELETCQYTINPNLSYSLLFLDDLFQHPKAATKRFSLDIKSVYHNPTSVSDSLFAAAVFQLITTYNLKQRITIESYSVSFLNELNELDPELELYFYPGTTYEAGLPVVLQNGFDGLTISAESLTASQVENAHSLGIKIITWGMRNKKENKSAVALNPDVIETDDVKYLLRYLNKK